MLMELSSIFSQFTPKRLITRDSGRNPGRAPPGFVNLHKYPTKSGNLPTRLCLASGNGAFKELHGVGERDGVIIVDHGSRRKESNLMLDEFVAMFRDKTGYPIVEPAHMELADPSISDAFSLCVQQGANRVIVSPFFLFPGRHWHRDIPSLTADAAKEHPGVSYIITAPLGLHELIVGVVNDRIGHCLDHVAGLSSVRLLFKDVVNERIGHCLSHVAGDAAECSVCAGTGKCRVY